MEDKQADSDRIRQRNIVDMLRDDQASGSKKNWKVFRDKLRLKHAGKAWTSSVRIPASDIPMPGKANSMMMTRRGSLKYSGDDDDSESGLLGQRSGRLLPLETDVEEEEGYHAKENEEKQDAGETMSLMTLLSTDGSNYVDEEEECSEGRREEAKESDDEEDVGEYQTCCRCKSKRKVTVLGPCGHTFCKYCMKELHVSKGNCFACNDFILEILDLF